jgi:Protein kinase domain
VTPERWRQITDVFHAARGRDAQERAEFLAEACRDDEVMRREVESMLAQPFPSNQFVAGVARAVAADLETGRASVLAGRRFGSYELEDRIGVGGMGEVYRARDTKLGRAVAIKILPWAFTNDPNRLARFEREARMLAALNHPQIGAIYGFEEADGVRGLVLELVPGDTLAAHVKRAPIPLPEAIESGDKSQTPSTQPMRRASSIGISSLRTSRSRRMESSRFSISGWRNSTCDKRTRAACGWSRIRYRRRRSRWADRSRASSSAPPPT